MKIFFLTLIFVISNSICLLSEDINPGSNAYTHKQSNSEYLENYPIIGITVGFPGLVSVNGSYHTKYIEAKGNYGILSYSAGLAPIIYSDEDWNLNIPIMYGRLLDINIGGSSNWKNYWSLSLEAGYGGFFLGIGTCFGKYDSFLGVAKIGYQFKIQ